MIELESANRLDTMRILADLEQERTSEFKTTRGLVARLYSPNISCTGFMTSNRDAQLRFAVEEGLIPRE